MAPPWPTAAWAESSPAAQGVDPAALAQLDSEFASGRYGYVNGFLVIRHSAVVFDRSYTHDYASLFASAPDQKRGPYNYYDPSWHPYYEGGLLQTMQSVSKSVTSALIGIALYRGELSSIDSNVLPFLADYRLPADPLRQKWTIRHLLTMSAGIKWEEVALPYSDPNNTCAQMEAAQDWVQFVLDQPQVAEPGATFVYNSGATQLLSQVLKHATGMHADAYAQAYLFKPLGISSYYWKHTPTGHADTEGGLYLTPRDLAKIGYLFLRGGVWDGTRILAEEFVRASAMTQISTGADSRGLDYGFQWWVERRPEGAAYAALGYGGQRLIVIPDLDLVAVFTGWNIFATPPLDTRFAIERLRQMVQRR
ncbi:MAG TPA: serine hydrolase [Vicinamibacterales bacterium]|nr:serine hydrolase [Vicinamibacterales bacterium]